MIENFLMKIPGWFVNLTVLFFIWLYNVRQIQTLDNEKIKVQAKIIEGLLADVKTLREEKVSSSQFYDLKKDIQADLNSMKADVTNGFKDVKENIQIMVKLVQSSMENVVEVSKASNKKDPT